MENKNASFFGFACMQFMQMQTTVPAGSFINHAKSKVIYIGYQWFVNKITDDKAML